jgi:predicted oxidoreductase
LLEALDSLLVQVVDSLSDWTSVVSKFETIYQGSIGKSLGVENFTPDPTSTRQRRLLYGGITNLVHAKVHHTTSKYNNIMTNVWLLAFAISWFGMVGFCFIHQIAKLTVFAKGELDFPETEGDYLNGFTRSVQPVCFFFTTLNSYISQTS